MSDLISRADAIEAFGLSEKTRKYGGDHSGYDTMLKYEIQDVLENLPSAEAESDDLIIKGAKGIKDGLYNIKDGKLFQYKANGGTVRTYPIVEALPSAEAEHSHGDGQWYDLTDALTVKRDAVDVVRCGECKYKRLYDEGDTKYYYCALEDRPNRNWSIDDTDYCSWGERREDGEDDGED